MPTEVQLWAFLPWGYLLTILLETPVLLLGLSRVHSLKRRFLSGLWLTAATYPIVVLVLPILVWKPYGRWPYLIIAETFAPLAECALFLLAYAGTAGWSRGNQLRDMLVITAANLWSFLAFEAVQFFR